MSAEMRQQGCAGLRRSCQVRNGSCPRDEVEHSDPICRVFGSSNGKFSDCAACPDSKAPEVTSEPSVKRSPVRGPTACSERRAEAAGRLSKIAISLSNRCFPAMFISPGCEKT